MTKTIAHCDICGYIEDNEEKIGYSCPRCSLVRLSEFHREMIKEELTSYKHTCLRCGKIWTSKVESPSCCSYCSSRYWNKERKNKVKV